LFQVHLWLGIGAGLYVLAISVSGSAIVYRRELTRKYAREIAAVADSNRSRMSIAELEQTVQRAYAGYEVLTISEPERRDQPDVVILQHVAPQHVTTQQGNKRIERLFDPYTGADLGSPRSGVAGTLDWLVDLHDNLLSGQNGRIANGSGALLVTLLALTGVVIWWPGVKNWRRSTTVNWTAHFPRFNWDLHSAVGFWCSLLVLVWGISGICLCFPEPLNFLVAGQFRLWITRLHFGRFGWWGEALWTLLGLAPAVLACTGALMWWNRVLRKNAIFRKFTGGAHRRKGNRALSRAS
jgi:uncharacterized iron-regulated membrane protein